MRRRDFLGAIAASGPGAVLGAAAARDAQDPVARGAPFRLDYAPPIGMFRNHCEDPVDQIHFAADHGFRAIEDNGMPRRPVAVQEAMRRALDRHGMRMGVFVATAEWQKPNFATDDPAATEQILKEMRAAVEVAQRVGAKWCTVVPGRFHEGLEPDFQTAYVVDNLRRACEVVEPSGLVLVLEPLNSWRDHPGMFLRKIGQAFLICRAVRSPSCKILFDMYHQQISEGNIIPNIDRAWSEVAYFQVGDNPGRNEPGTGEMNYKRIFAHLRGKGWAGIVGMEHGRSQPGKDGELRVIEAYRECDAE